MFRLNVNVCLILVECLCVVVGAEMSVLRPGCLLRVKTQSCGIHSLSINSFSCRATTANSSTKSPSSRMETSQ